jgi:malate dehydrogenase (oxaloacetate-decarboxylating)
VELHTSAGNAVRLRLVLESVPGTLGRLTTAIGKLGGDIEAIDLIDHRGKKVVREIIVNARDRDHRRAIVAGVATVAGVEIEEVSDRTFDIHKGGKIEVTSRLPLKNYDDLSRAYTPGVGRVSMAIAGAPEKVWDYTIKRNAVAVLSDGTAVLGLGNIGPEAAMPVMEGKSMLFKEFAGVDAFPICVRVDDADGLVQVAIAISPGFGGINLEDIAAPRCFEVERRLLQTLDIPVFHDDQHGTAVVTLAALTNAARVVGKRLADMTAVVMGIGAAGVACTRLLLAAGVGNVIAVDRQGILDAETQDLDEGKLWVAENTNLYRRRGGPQDALRDADVFVGVSGPNTVRPEWLAQMAPGAIAFVLANPVPEIMPELIPANVQVVATGRSDYPNQINNVLVFPGFFRGLLDARARTVDDTMKLAAARALADLIDESELSEEYVIPSVFDRRVAPVVAAAVRSSAAHARGGPARNSAAGQQYGANVAYSPPQRGGDLGGGRAAQIVEPPTEREETERQ